MRLLATLQQKTTFNSKSDYLTLRETREETMAFSYSHGFGRNTSCSDVVIIKIPHNTISTLESPLLTVVYEVMFFMEISGYNKKHFKEIPIFIF